MNSVPINRTLSFDVTYDSPSLSVAMTVYDDSGASPVIVQGPSAMGLITGGTYRGKFTPTALKNYLIYKAVYTDNTYTTLHPDYLPGSETVIAISPIVNGIPIRSFAASIEEVPNLIAIMTS